MYVKEFQDGSPDSLYPVWSSRSIDLSFLLFLKLRGRVKIHDAMICWPSPDHFLWCLPVIVQCPRLLQEVMMYSPTSLTEQPDAVDHSRAFWDSCNLRVRVPVLYIVYLLLVCISNLLVGRNFWKSS